MIKLDKDIVFFDLETTGVALALDRIVDIALLKRRPDGSEESFSSLVDPEMPIPAEASAIHHITDEMVRGMPTFRALATRILDFIGLADLSGFNVARFDIPMLQAEFKRVGINFPLEGRRVVDAFVVFQRMEPRSLTAAYKFYCGKSLDGAHRAEADARASHDVLWAQLERYQDLPKDIAGLSAYCSQKDPRNVDAEGKFVWRNGKAAFNFGKFRSMGLDEVAKMEPSYLQWLMKADKTTPELAQICREALRGRFPTKA